MERSCALNSTGTLIDMSAKPIGWTWNVSHRLLPTLNNAMAATALSSDNIRATLLNPRKRTQDDMREHVMASDIFVRS